MPTGGTPLAALPLPAPQPGCTLELLPDWLGLTVASNGSAGLDWPLPDDPSLAGVLVHLQMVAIEVGGAGALVATTSTNALRLVTGVF